jgi:hypothetical protein
MHEKITSFTTKYLICHLLFYIDDEMLKWTKQQSMCEIQQMIKQSTVYRKHCIC